MCVWMREKQTELYYIEDTQPMGEGKEEREGYVCVDEGKANRTILHRRDPANRKDRPCHSH